MTQTGSRAVGLGLALVGAAAIYLASGFREGTAHGGPGTRFMPVLLGVIVIVLGAVLALQRSTLDAPVEAHASGGGRRAIWTLGAIVAYVLAYGRFGFLLATVPFLAILLLVYGERRWPVILAVAVGATGVTYALFAVWLGVPLPSGPLGW